MRKTLSFVLMFFIIGCFVFLLSSCGGGQSEKETTKTKCEHTYVESAVERTDYNEGYTLHKCSKCGYSYKTDKKSSYLDAAKKGLDAVITKLKSNLKDPDSLQYDGVCAKRRYEVTDTEPSKVLYMYKIHYNAKNGFGGYVGYKYVYYDWNENFNTVGTMGEDYYNTYYYSAFFTF